MNDARLLQFPKGSNVEFGADGSKDSERARVDLSFVREYWTLFKRYKWIILTFALIGAGVGYLNAATETPIYKSQLTMLIQPPGTNRGRAEEASYRYVSSYLFYQTQYGIIRSRAVAERTADKLDLSKYSWVGRQQKKNYWGVIRELLDVKRDDQTQDYANLTADNKKKILHSMIQGGIKVESERQSQLVKLLFESHDPEFAADVVNTAAEAYMALSLDARLAQAQVATGWLSEQVENLRAKVAKAEANLQTFQASENLVDSEKNQELVKSRLSALTESYIRAQSKVAQLEERYGYRHPSLIAAKSERAELKKRLDEEKQQAVGSQMNDFKLAKLERDAATYRQLYDQILTRVKETSLATQYNIVDARVIDKAEVPGAPIRPSKRRIVFSYFALGLMLGLFLIWLRDRLDNTYKNPAEIEQRTGLPVVGVIPYLRNKKDRLLPERYYLNNIKSGFTESINHIRTSVLYTNVDHPPKVIMVTSSLQSEGKTTLSSNLALSFSQVGKTLLIDADMRKPRVADIIGLSRVGGLSDVIAGQAKISDSFSRDKEADQLFIMKCGTQPPNPLELISSKKFQSMLKELRENFDHIIIDSAPVLPVSDAIVLGNNVDGTLMVVRAEKTNRPAVTNALSRLSNANVPVFGIVLSQVTAKNISYYYSDGSYGYYGAYYGNQKSAAIS
jgi:capsular exopolysaccharide synthesis family protein